MESRKNKNPLFVHYLEKIEVFEIVHTQYDFNFIIKIDLSLNGTLMSCFKKNQFQNTVLGKGNDLNLQLPIQNIR